MAIPDTINGFLPEGIYNTSLYEVLQRFSYKGQRRSYLGNLLAELYDVLWRAGGTELVIGGSFTTDTEDPNDIDCAILLPHDQLDDIAQRWDRKHLVHLDIKPCFQPKDIVAWYGVLQLDRSRKTFRGCLKIGLPPTNTSISEKALGALSGEPLAGQPRGLFPNTPRDEIEGYLAKYSLNELYKQIKRGEGLPKKIVNKGLEFLQHHDPTGASKILLPDDFNVIWNKLEKIAGIESDRLSDLIANNDDFILLQNLKEIYRQIPEESLRRIYKSSLGKPGNTDIILSALNIIIPDANMPNNSTHS